jgi:hypothetical protein
VIPAVMPLVIMDQRWASAATGAISYPGRPTT